MLLLAWWEDVSLVDISQRYIDQDGEHEAKQVGEHKSTETSDESIYV